MKKWQKILLVLLVVLFCGGVVLSLPVVRNSLSWRLDQLRIRVVYALFPPEKEVFVPETPLQTPAAVPTATAPAPTATLAPELPTSTPQPTPTQLPQSVVLEGIQYTDQHNGWNNCGPANLTMALSYFDWEGQMLDVASVLKPFAEDKNVMPYEMADYVNTQTNLRAVVRQGGTLEGVKNLIANQIPVLLEIGTFRIRDLNGKYSWMGHYQVINGYDDAAGELILQDSYLTNGQNYRLSYDTLLAEWRSFNFIYVVIYPPEQETLVMNLLGASADETAADREAYAKASAEVYSLTGVDQVFAWYNRGTSMVRLQDYQGAAQSFDEAFRLMAALPEEQRPYRLPWYQTGPYFAYFYAGRYQDVINLADSVLEPLERTKKPYLEESFYWRARAKNAVGDVAGAIEDLRRSLEYHPGFTPSEELLSALGG